MNHNKGFIGVLIIILITAAVIGGGGYLYLKNKSPKNAGISKNNTAQNSYSSISSQKNIIASNSGKNPWPVFQKFLSYIKNHDVNGLNTVSYKPFSCPDAQSCSQMLDFIYGTISQLNENDFVNKWEDGKQIILSTNAKRADARYEIGYIFFTKDNSGNLKVLSVNPAKGWSHTTENTNLTSAQIEQELQKMMKDSDQDGLTDQQETCTGASQYKPGCKKTDPTKRDTNGNGWWDGIEAEF